MPRRLLTFIAAQLLLFGSCLLVSVQADEPPLLLDDVIGGPPPLPSGYALHPLGRGVGGNVYAVLDVGVSVYVAGSFTQAYNGQQSSVATPGGFARWNKSEQQWQAVDTGYELAIKYLAEDANGVLYAAGDGYRDGDYRVDVLRYSDGQWQALPSVIGQLSGIAIDQQTGELYAYGYFETVEYESWLQAYHILKKWDGSAWQSIGGGGSTNYGGMLMEPYPSISYSKGQHGFYVGGSFQQVHQADGSAVTNTDNFAFWSLREQRWLALPNKPQVTGAPTIEPTPNHLAKFSYAVFQEYADGDRVIIGGVNNKWHRFRWTDGSWAELGQANDAIGLLLPDDKRLFTQSIGYASEPFSLQEIGENSITKTGLRYYQGASQTMSLGEDGLYVGITHGMIDLSDPYTPHYIVRLEIPDMDGDGVANADDKFPLDPQESQDTDGDGVGDNADNCPAVANTEQSDRDGDLIGDACDAFPADINEAVDSDGDGVGDNRDQLPEDPSRWFSGELPPERIGTAAKQAYGEVLVNVGDIDGDSVADYAIGIPQFSPIININGKSKRLNKAGRVELYSGKTGELLWSQNGTAAKQLFGSAIAAGLIDSDTQRDLAIGAPGSNKNSGAVQLCLMHVEAGSLSCKPNSSQINAPQDAKGSLFGSSVAVTSAGQLLIGAPRAINRSKESKTIANGLRLYELLVGSNEVLAPQPLKNVLNKPVGAVYFIKAQSAEVESVVYGAAANGELGARVLIDDIGNMLASAPRALKTGLVAHIQQDGASLLIAGKDGDREFGHALASVCQSQWKSPWPGYEAGWYTSCQHVIGAPQASVNGLKQVGRVQVLSVDDFRGGPHYAGEEIVGTSAGENFGASVTAVNSKIGVQLFVGSPHYSAAKTTASNALKHAGKLTQFELSTDQAIAEQGNVLAIGKHAGQQLGSSLLAMDLTGDFLPEALIGSVGANDATDKKLKAIGKVEVLSLAE